MMDTNTLARAGEDFGSARLSNVRRASVPPEYLPVDEEEAYAVQRAAIKWMSANGAGKRVGYKVANVSVDMKKLLSTMGIRPFGIDTPIYGPIMNKHIHHGVAEIVPFDNEFTFIECEFGIRMGRDAPPINAPYTYESISECIDACMAGIEIAAATFEKADYEHIAPRGVLNVADNSSNRGAIFGPPVTNWQTLELPALTARVLKDGKEFLNGRADSLLGHPFEVAAWLANRLIDHGTQLNEGEHILLGSIGRGVSGNEFKLRSGDEVIACWDELGEARIRIT